MIITFGDYAFGPDNEADNVDSALLSATGTGDTASARSATYVSSNVVFDTVSLTDVVITLTESTG